MRVTFVNKYYPPHLGGIEYHLRDLAEELASRDGVEVTVLVANEGRATVEEVVGGVRVVRESRAFAYASTPVAPRMRSRMRGLVRETDVFHLNFPYPWGEVAWLSAGRGVPSVVWYHSDIVRQKVLGALYGPVADRVLDRASAVIAGSPQMAANSPVLQRHAAKVRVVPYGIHTERYDATPEVMRRAEELRSQHSRPVVLFVGRLVYYKGVDVLLRALPQLDCDLVAIGSGPLEGELRALAAGLGCDGRVTFLPHAGDLDLRAWYRAADVFCLPSVAPSEAFGLVQVEAHASGTPVVSTRLGTGVEFANEHGVTGLTVEPNDPAALAEALGSLLGDESLRTRLGEQAARRAREVFSVGRMADEVTAVYRSL
ncbi:MAG: glycosyltransferase [Actinobacteria bacterium]|nr:MAG: glycosyltransferase [Actinomycetota bacterium]